MKIFKTFISICLALVFLVSCGSRKPEKQALPEPIILTQTKEVKEVVRDTIFRVEADSSFYKAYIDCKDGKPKLINTKSKSGKNLLPPLVNIDKNGMLSVRAETKARELFKQWKEQHIKENVPEPVYVDKIIYKNKPFSWYHKALMWLGGFTVAAFGLWLIRFIKPKI